MTCRWLTAAVGILHRDCGCRPRRAPARARVRQVERPEERQPAPAAPELQQLRPAVGLWRRGPASAEPKRWHDRLDRQRLHHFFGAASPSAARWPAGRTTGGTCRRPCPQEAHPKRDERSVDQTRVRIISSVPPFGPSHHLPADAAVARHCSGAVDGRAHVLAYSCSWDYPRGLQL